MAVTSARTGLHAAQGRARLLQVHELAELAERGALAWNEQQEAELSLQLIQAGPRDDEIAAAQAEMDKLNARRTYLQEQRICEVVSSYIDGTVTTP